MPVVSSMSGRVKSFSGRLATLRGLSPLCVGCDLLPSSGGSLVLYLWRCTDEEYCFRLQHTTVTTLAAMVKAAINIATVSNTATIMAVREEEASGILGISTEGEEVLVDGALLVLVGCDETVSAGTVVSGETTQSNK